MDITIREALTEKERRKILRAVRRYPGEWIAQKRFSSVPLTDGAGGACHLCVGVFTVNGRAAGFYGRSGVYPRIDRYAKDIPILIRNEE